MGPQYTAVADETLAAVHVAVFIRNDLFKQVGRVGTDRVATGIANIIGNKGGVGVSMDIGTTSFLFVCAHFAAHQEQVARRNLDFKKINNKLKLGLERQPDVALAQDRFERVFWMGDLNYRVNGTRKMVDVLMKRDMHEVMLANDQLIMEMDKREVFKGFEEGDITFKPTYKFDTGFDRYDTSSKQRIPAWTDRVLYKRSRKVKLEKYDACADVRSSDHKPVYAIFSVAFVPLERKAEAAPDLSGKSSACSIM
jgi:phosphatidylinositol-bisphosphatase